MKTNKIENGIRVAVLPKSRRYSRIKEQQGTVLGYVGYGDYAVQFDRPLPLDFSQIHYMYDETSQQRKAFSNVCYINQKSIEIVEVNVGDLEDDY